MTNTHEPFDLYEQLRSNEPVKIEVGGISFAFQFFGPDIGKSNNWLEVTRDDGLSWRFGPGHESELVWRALRHAEGKWEDQPVPRFKQSIDKDEDLNYEFLDVKHK
jgi:hypothetical protein